MYIEDKDIHKGHRARMKDKLERFGPRIFDTYELLEILLYYAIPYKDTNPIAKRLLAAFGSLDGVMSAPIEELAKIDGIGERCATLISEVGAVMLEERAYAHRREVRVFDDYRSTGEFIVSHMASSGANISVMLLDSSMRLIATEDIPADDFTTAAVKPKYFINAALAVGASVAILAHKRKSLLYFSDLTLATDKLIRSELNAIGVTVAEHYVVCGNDYAGLRSTYTLGASYRGPELERFLESVPGERGGNSGR